MRALVCLIGLMSLPGLASAERLTLSFDRLEGVQQGASVEVLFDLSPESWKAIDAKGIRPVLIAEALSRGRRSTLGRARIVRKGGRFVVPIAEDMRPHSVRFALQHPLVAGFREAGVGVGTTTRPVAWGGGAAGPATGVASVRAAPERRGRRIDQDACVGYGEDAALCRRLVGEAASLGAAAVVACAEFGDEAIGCLRRAGKANEHAANIVRACNAGQLSRSDRLRCIELAATARVDGAALVRACGRALPGPGSRLSCISRAAASRGNPAGVVEQCAFSFSGTPARLDCISTAGRGQVDLAPAVAACKQTMPWDTSRRRCIEAAAMARVDISSAIIACRSGASSPAATLRCVRYAAQGDNPGIAGAIHGCGRDAGDDTTFNACVAQVAANTPN